jgi:uncharacterized protein
MIPFVFDFNTFLLFVAAILAGIFNGIAGGGSFLTFPALVFTGLSMTEANATSTLALWFGGLASTVAYRNFLGKPKEDPSLASTNKDNSFLNGRFVYALAIVSLLGGGVGACLLLFSSDEIFRQVVPFLMALATGLFAFSPNIKYWLSSQDRTTHLPFVGTLLTQFSIAVYGGYFGGGVSILMLAGFNFMGFSNIHAMNGLKSLLGNCMNGVAIVAFIIAQKIAFPPAILMAFGAVLGAYLSAIIAQKVSQTIVRNVITGVACTMTFYLFMKA